MHVRELHVGKFYTFYMNSKQNKTSQAAAALGYLSFKYRWQAGYMNKLNKMNALALIFIYMMQICMYMYTHAHAYIEHMSDTAACR